MRKNIYPLKQLEIPTKVIARDGPFSEFKQDASFVTIELNSGAVVTGVLLLYPSYVIAVEGHDDLPFPQLTLLRQIKKKKI